MTRTHHEHHDSRRDRMSFETLYDDHFDAIFRFVLYRVGNVPEAEDLTSQTFFKALKSFWRFRWSAGSPSAWLHRIAINEINSHYRRVRAGRLEPSLLPADEQIVSEAAEAERALARNDVFQELNRCLLRLQPEDQVLVVLRYLEEKSFGEIASIVKKRTGAVTMRTHRALRKLKLELEKQGIDHERFREGFEGPAAAHCAGEPVQADVAP